MSILIGRYFGNDSTQELHQDDDDGSYSMRTFIRDRDLDRPATTAEAMAWYEHMRRNGGAVYREVTGWPAKGDAP